jgi:threonine synthase
MLCVQSSATPPVVRAFDSGADDTTVVDAGSTRAFGLNVPGGVGHARVLQILRASGGAAVAVEESQIAREMSRLWQWRRDWISPEGAACVAAIPQLRERGMLHDGERVVAVNTGSLEKYLPAVRDLLPP